MEPERRVLDAQLMFGRGRLAQVTGVVVVGIILTALVTATTSQLAEPDPPITPPTRDIVAATLQDAAHGTPLGFVTYRATGGDVYRLDARPGSRPVDISAMLDRLSPRAPDEWLNTSANGRWLLTDTELRWLGLSGSR